MAERNEAITPTPAPVTVTAAAATSDDPRNRKVSPFTPPRNNLSQDELLAKTFYDILQQNQATSTRPVVFEVLLRHANLRTNTRPIINFQSTIWVLLAHACHAICFLLVTSCWQCIVVTGSVHLFAQIERVELLFITCIPF